MSYNRASAGVAADIDKMRPVAPVLAAVDPILQTPIDLSHDEFNDLVLFIRKGLTDPRATPATLCNEIPAFTLSGRELHKFEGCPQN